MWLRGKAGHAPFSAYRIRPGTVAAELAAVCHPVRCCAAVDVDGQAAQLSLSGRKAGQSVASASCRRPDPYAVLGGEAAPAILLLGAVSQFRLPMGRALLCVLRTTIVSGARVRAFEAILPPKCTSPHIRSADGPLSSDRFASLFRALRAWFEPTSSQVTLELNYLYC